MSTPMSTPTPMSTLPLDPMDLFEPLRDGVEVINDTEQIEVTLGVDVKPQHESGQTTRYEIQVDNNRDESLDGTVVRATIPLSTTFQSETIFAASAGTVAQQQGQYWELPDGGGPCPDGYPGGNICLYRIGTLTANTEALSLFLNVQPDDALTNQSTNDLQVMFAAADVVQRQIIQVSLIPPQRLSSPNEYLYYLPVIQR